MFKFMVKFAVTSILILISAAVILFTTNSYKDVAEKLFIFLNYRKVRLPNGKLLEGPDKLLGSGSFGTVARYKIDQKNIALKLPRSQKYNEFQRHEVELIKKANSHPNIMNYYEPVYVDGCIGIIMDLMTGTVKGLLDKYPSLSWSTKLSIALQLTNGLVHLHNLDNAYISIKTIVHQDLKTDNLLIDRVEDSPDIQVKISDFGLARQVNQITLPILGKISAKLKEGHVGGTLLYTAPEVIDAMARSKECCEPKSDVFSTGIILWEIATNNRPNRSNTEISEGRFNEFEVDAKKDQRCVTSYSLFGNKVTYIPTYPKSGHFGPIISKCIKPRVEDRPSATALQKDLQEIKV